MPPSSIAEKNSAPRVRRRTRWSSCPTAHDGPWQRRSARISELSLRMCRASSDQVRSRAKRSAGRRARAQHRGSTSSSKARISPPAGSGGRRTRKGWSGFAAGRLIDRKKSLNYVRFHDDFPAFPLTNFWEDTQSGSGMDKVYVVQTNTKVIERCLLMTSDPGDLVLDPTCGSGSTAVVAEEWGRRWITIDTSRVAVALARTRLAALRLPYYLLTDSPAGARKEADLRDALRHRATSVQTSVAGSSTGASLTSCCAISRGTPSFMTG